MAFRQSTVFGLILGCTALVAPAQAITVKTAPFISSPTATVGFEGLGAITSFDGVNSYSENGVAVSYVGSGLIWSYSQPTPDGQYSWYPDGGGYGYTSFKFAPATGFELLVSSGWYDGGYVLNYEVLLGGSVIASGVAGAAPAYASGWMTYGFTGATFDEVHLQVTGPGFDPSVLEAGAYDAVKIGAPGAVPEPASWALMIAGFGIAGGVLRRAQATRLRFA